MDLGGAKGGVKSDINVTPLVDVMLVLLIIIMLIAPMLQEGISVKLPRANNSADKPETAGQTVVAISPDGRVFVNAVQIQKPEEELAPRVKTLVEDKGPDEKVVIIKADEEVDYRVVMMAMDKLREAGIEDMGLITEKPSGGAGGGQQ
jgi:biopolymer transport protein ExbD